MKSIWSYYTASAWFTTLSILVCFFYAGLPGALLAALLGILEVSVSLDNAVVNAKVLETMSDKWKRAFLTWGMVISVFGVRVLFPIIIVWCTSTMTFTESVMLPFVDAHKYADTVTAAHLSIAGFGGAFLLMVFCAFFMDEEKEDHWLPGIERLLSSVGSLTGSQLVSVVGMATITIAIFSFFIPDVPDPKAFHEFVLSGLAGIVTWLVVHFIGNALENKNAVTDITVKAGLGTFIYLNILDASFSFDGVIGAFAISNDIIVIGLGLGIGSMFVRSMTIHMVDKGTLGSLKYLEHGAFWSIGVLAFMMFLSTFMEIPEVVTGLSAAGILGVAALHSLMAKNQKSFHQGVL